jgi:hypothetical protein
MFFDSLEAAKEIIRRDYGAPQKSDALIEREVLNYQLSITDIVVPEDVTLNTPQVIACQRMEKMYYDLLLEHLHLKETHSRLVEDHSALRGLVNGMQSQLAILRKALFGWFSFDLHPTSGREEEFMRIQMKSQFLDDLIKESA